MACSDHLTLICLQALRGKAEDIRAKELEKALSKLGDGMTKKQMKTIEELSRGIVNKLLHGPMTALRCVQGPNALQNGKMFSTLVTLFLLKSKSGDSSLSIARLQSSHAGGRQKRWPHVFYARSESTPAFIIQKIDILQFIFQEIVIKGDPMFPVPGVNRNPAFP